MRTITDISSKAIIDSRGKPTIAVTVAAGDSVGSFSVPSGASRGTSEAYEMRDPDGGVERVRHNIETILKPALLEMDVSDQSAIDTKMRELDGTEQKTNLGGNAIIGVSIAAAKAAAIHMGLPVYAYLRSLASIPSSRPVPYLYLNYINGGKHADSPLAFQEHLIVPECDSIAEALESAAAIERTLTKLITDMFGGHAARSIGDEGGFVLPTADYEIPFKLLSDAVGLSGKTAHLACDVAASTFYSDGAYRIGGETYSPLALDDLYLSLAKKYTILSIEDPFAEESFADFARLQAETYIRLVGDDLTTTNTARITRAADAGSIKAIIIKPNQIGTLSETLEAMRTARERDIDCIVSHRSGETDDDFIADLAFAFGCFAMKAGSLRKPERVAKYERLKAIAV